MQLLDVPFLIPIFLILIGLIFESFFSSSFERVLKIYFYLVVLFIIILAGSRYKIGPDWPGYYDCFNFVNLYKNIGIEELTISTGFERGYVFLNYIFANLGLSYWSFNLLFAGLSIYLKSKTMINYSKFIFVSLLLYYIPSFFFEDIVQIRQGFATGITIFSVKYIIEKKLWKFLICVLIAYEFHKSSFIFILAYWIGNSNIKFQYLIFLCFFSLILFPVGLSKNFTFFIDYIPIDGVKNGFNSYSKTGYAGELGFTIGDAVKISYLFLIIFYNELCESLDENNSYKVLRNLYLVSIIFYFFFHDQVIFASRLISYYTSTIYLLAPLILYNVKSKSKTAFLILLFLLLVYQILLFFRFNSLHSFYLYEYRNYMYPTESNQF